MAEPAGAYPGDDLVAAPLLVADRHAVLPAPPPDVWPWIAQLGKERSGWYLPRSVERLLPARRRALRRIEPAFQAVQAGDKEADYGPGDPVFRCALVDPPRALVWHTLRDTADRHRWPADPAVPTVIALSWALLLDEDREGRTHLHVRMRMTKGAWHDDPLFRVKAPLMDLFDRLTVLGLFAGLRERVMESAP